MISTIDYEGAKAALGGKLEFGNLKQIAAIRVIEQFEEERKELDATGKRVCSICDGEGEHECECGHRHTCAECEGIGRVD